MHALFAALDDAATRTCVEAERAMNRALHGSCHVPVAAFAQRHADALVLSGLVGSAAEGQVIRADGRGPLDDPEGLGRSVAARAHRHQFHGQAGMRLAQACSDVFALPEGERALAGGDAQRGHAGIIPHATTTAQVRAP